MSNLYFLGKFGTGIMKKIHFGVMFISENLEMGLQNDEKFKKIGHFEVNFLGTLRNQYRFL